MEERLQKILAKSGICSRRRAEDMIRAGRVQVDGRVVTVMGVKVDPQHQRLTVDGKPVSNSAKKIYILVNKPRGYITTMKDPQGRPLVTELTGGIKERLFPVGRLDLDTEGALLMTNDGALAQRVIHPSFEIKKTYLAVVNGRVGRRKIEALRKGIDLDGRQTWPAEIEVTRIDDHSTTLQIIIHEGRKRQVRRMFAAVGYKVTYLKRLAYGGLRLGNLRTGKYRFLNKKDLQRIFSKNILYK
ncbi:pseudouridine synthase [Desulfobacterota bacterium M19]